MAIVLRIFLVRSMGDERVVPHAAARCSHASFGDVLVRNRRFFANGLPEPDLKYHSRLSAR